MKTLLATALLVTSMTASATITHFEDPKSAMKIQLVDLPTTVFVQGQKINYIFPGGKTPTKGVVTIVSVGEDVTDGIVDGNLSLQFGKGMIFSQYKARFNTKGLQKIRLKYQGAAITFSKTGFTE